MSPMHISWTCYKHFAHLYTVISSAKPTHRVHFAIELHNPLPHFGDTT